MIALPARWFGARILLGSQHIEDRAFGKWSCIRRGRGWEASDGVWVEAEPKVDGGLPVFFEGERIAAQITNRHTAPIYVSVLDFGLTGALGLLYPWAGASEELAPGKCIELGRDAAMR